jgi:hypothetical protein
MEELALAIERHKGCTCEPTIERRDDPVTYYIITHDAACHTSRVRAARWN